MLKELTLTVEEDMYDMLREMNETDALKIFFKTAIIPHSEGIFVPKQFDPEKAAAVREKLFGMFKNDGHEVDRFLEEKRHEKSMEDEIWARRDRESGGFKNDGLCS
jgi:hypothetical protein